MSRKTDPISARVNQNTDSVDVNRDFDLTEKVEVKNAVWLYLQHCGNKMLIWNAWKTSMGFSAAQSVFVHVTQFIFQCYCDMDLRVNARKVSCTTCSDKSLATTNGFDFKALFA